MGEYGKMKENNTRCETCKYWKVLRAADGTKACHFLLDTGKRRVADGERCLSYKKK